MASDINNIDMSPHMQNILSNMMCKMDSMESKLQEQDGKMINLNAEVKQLKEENATLRYDLEEQKETTEKLSSEVNHLKEDNAMLRKESQDSGTGQKAREETSCTKNSKISEGALLIETIEELYKSIDPFAHIAIKRESDEFEEFIFEGCNNANEDKKEVITIYKRQNQSGETKNLTMEEIRNAISGKKMYIIKDATSSSEENTQQQDRSSSRHIMRFGGCFLCCIQVSSFVEEATSAVVNVAKRIPFTNTTTRSVADCQVGGYAKTICKKASEKLGGDSYLIKILKDEKCINVAKTASKESLKKSASVNFIITGVLETGIAFYDIYHLNSKNLSTQEYKREVKKKFLEVLGATGGSVVSGMTGQILCPIPVVGYAVGSLVGNYGGRFVASRMVN